MTTVAARNNVMAGDSRVTEGDSCERSTPKVRRIGEWVVGMSGNYFDMQRVWNWLEGGRKGRMPPTKRVTILAGRNGALWYWEAVNGELVSVPVAEPYAAIGNGREVALGAMYAGAGAVKAVRAAIKHDAGSGGAVVSLRYG